MPSSDLDLHILLIEDNAADAGLLFEMLDHDDSQRWHIIHVKRLADAIAHLQTHPVDIALVDLSLPDSQGLETVSRFGQTVGTMPFIVLTGIDDRKLALQAMSQGAQDYLVKGQITTDLLSRTTRYAVERGRILQRLRDSERRFRGVFEQSFQAMSLLTPEGIVLESNRTVLNLHGIQSQVLAGIPLWETDRWNYSRSSQEQLKQAVKDAVKGQVVRFESQLRNGDNELVWVDFSLKPVHNDSGKVILLIAEARDISDRKQAEIEIQQALAQERELHQMKSSFISMVSHEFRTPMTVLQMSVGLLKRQDLSTEKKERYYSQIDSAMSGMLSLLDEILLLARTVSGRFEYNPAPFHLHEFCRDLSETFQLSAQNSHTIEFCYRGIDTPVQGDRILLEHILTNLLSNAIKYSPNGKRIGFDVAYGDGMAQFRVQDEGIGIPQTDQEHLFEAFHRATNARTIQGTGLGLAIVKNCVDLHDGEITMSSQEQVGTTFTVTLPMAMIATSLPVG